MTREELRSEVIKKCGDSYTRCYHNFKYKNPVILNEIMLHTTYIPDNRPFKERLYHILSGIYEIPKCKLCEHHAVFRGIDTGYSLYCGKCYLKDPEFKKLQRENNIKLYKNHGEEIKKKIEKTNLKRYGISNPNKLQIIKDKIKNTTLKNLGVEYSQQNEEVKQKTKNTNLERRGVTSSFQSVEVKRKIKETNIKRYGYGCCLKNPLVKEKRRRTLLRKYGVDNPSKIKSVMNKISDVNRETFLEKLKMILPKMGFELVDDVYKDNITNHKWKCIKCGHIFEENWRNMCRGYLCPICYPRTNTSISEKEIEDFISSLGLTVERNVRGLISRYELDILIRNKNVAIEYDGLYWHSDYFDISSDYHLNKTILCNKVGIHLIHIFEDEWLFKKELVKKMLEHILDVSRVNVLYGRDCVIKEIDIKEKNNFLNKFHIIGGDRSVIKLGGFYKDSLVSVMTFSHGNISKGSKPEKYIWELNRFCSDYNYRIPGIAGKLLSYFKKNYEWSSIFSYADRRWSLGNMYYKLGFDLVGETPPNYWYIRGMKRIHRYTLRKRPDEPKEITEEKLRLEEGYSKIWDCGSLKFVLNNKEKRNE